MRQFDFDKKLNFTGSDSIKWDPKIREQLGKNPAALPLWVADMDFSPPPAVMEALKQRLAFPFYGYAKLPEELLPAALNWLESRYQWKPASERITFIPGMLTGIAAAIRAVSKPEDGIVIQTPAYNPFFSLVEKNGRRIIRNPMILKGSRYTFDLPLLEQQLREEKTTGLLLCSPHNPAGRVWTEEELNALQELCRAYHVSVISDEIHADLTHRGHVHTPFPKVSEGVRSITCMAPTKTFCIPGEKIAFSHIADPDLKDLFQKELEAMAAAHLSIFAPQAALAGYQQGEAWLEALIVYLMGNKEFMKDFLQRYIPELTLIEPEASFISFIDCSNLIPRLQGKRPVRFFSEKAGVLMHDGAWFGKEGGNFVRINFGTQRSVLETALNRMAAAVADIR